MTTEIVNQNMRHTLAKHFKRGFSDTKENIGYVYISKSTPYANDQVVSEITDCTCGLKSVWDNMIAGKKILPGNIELAIPKEQWSSNTVYKQFDDKANTNTLLTADGDGRPMYTYVANTGNVYKCLNNNVGANSTIEPTGDYTSSNGYITTSDGYTWKYMYNVKNSNNFLLDDWIPVPERGSLEDYDMGLDYVTQGSLDLIIVTDGGDGFVHDTISMSAFSTGSTLLTPNNVSNVAANMLLSGTGLESGTYITSVLGNNKIIISTPATANGGGTGNVYSVETRVVIDGDGIGAAAEAVLDGDSILKISVTENGQNYTKANVIVYGTGSNSVVRSVLSPKYGHGYYPSIELNAKDVIIYSRIGEVDSTESGKISSDVSFRQYGLLIDPHLYGEPEVVEYDNAAIVISQTIDITVSSGVAYEKNELVYQGTNESDPDFYGRVIAESDNVLKITNYFGNIDVGGLLIGANSATQRPVLSFTNPEFEPYSGIILYNKNILSVERSEGQAEEIKFVLKF